MLAPITWYIIVGAVLGLSVRVWRYKIRGQVAAKNIAAACVSTSALVWYGSDLSPWAAFVTSYFAAQSMGYSAHLKTIKEKFKK